MAGFYASLDAFALPSVAEESFGISQAEAMMLGVPSVASDAPGMRVPVTETGFGRLFPPGDAHALAAALREVAAYPPERRAEGGCAARARYGTDHCLDAYDGLFREAGALRGTQEPARDGVGTPGRRGRRRRGWPCGRRPPGPDSSPPTSPSTAAGGSGCCPRCCRRPSSSRSPPCSWYSPG